MSLPTPAWLPFDRLSGDLEGQVYRAVRDRILSGHIAAGHRLPSTRSLARSLGVARSTVVNAYERLKSEGYLETAMGSASRVAPLAMPPFVGRQQPSSTSQPTAVLPATTAMFEPGVSDPGDFPHAVWARCLGARARALRVHDLGYSDSCGIGELREAILEHLSATRGVVARPEQVLVMPTTRAAIDLLGNLRLRTHGKHIAWMEDPGYASAKSLLQAAGARIVAVPCDDAGIDVSHVQGPAPGIIYVTPSHQYPSGATMSLQRRLALLDIAHATGALVLEDDYDSDFQYGSRPIAALQGIDRNDVVAYLGTFSKILAPGLRVAYAIVPSSLVQEASAALQLRGALVPIHVQAALADFIREGRLRAHLRQMNAKYAERMKATADALHHHCGRFLRIGDSSGGLQLATWFHDQTIDDTDIAALLRLHGMAPQPMSRFYLGLPQQGLMFGIARARPDQVDVAARTIAQLLDRHLQGLATVGSRQV